MDWLCFAGTAQPRHAAVAYACELTCFWVWQRGVPTYTCSHPPTLILDADVLVRTFLQGKLQAGGEKMKGQGVYGKEPRRVLGLDGWTRTFR